MIKKYIIYFSLAALVSSCGGGKYASTEKIYKKKAKDFSELYREAPVKGQVEKIAANNKEWIASTNFGVRKPNYVMIHHTAQKDLDQTVRTFHNEKVGAFSPPIKQSGSADDHRPDR